MKPTRLVSAGQPRGLNIWIVFLSKEAEKHYLITPPLPHLFLELRVHLKQQSIHGFSFSNFPYCDTVLFSLLDRSSHEIVSMATQNDQ
jgi:hypothetical protein